MRKIGNYLWIEKEGDEYTIIMTPELQDDVGTVGFVDFPDSKRLEKGDTILSLEASKTVLDIYSPLAGDVLAYNEKAYDEPTLLNSADETESWIVKLTNVDEAEFNALEDA